MPATRNRLLARLHCIKKEHGWDDDTYRDILYARTGKRSAGDLTGTALSRLVTQLGGEKPKNGLKRSNPWAFIDNAAEDNRPLLRKVCALCIDMGVGKAYAEGVALRQHGIERHLEMMTPGELWKVVAALERTRNYRRQDAPPAVGIGQSGNR